MKFKFLQQVKVRSPFYNEIVGEIMGCSEQKRGIWPFRKTFYVYLVTTQMDDMDISFYVEEGFISPLPPPPKLKPVR